MARFLTPEPLGCGCSATVPGTVGQRLPSRERRRLPRPRPRRRPSLRRGQTDDMAEARNAIIYTTNGRVLPRSDRARVASSRAFSLSETLKTRWDKLSC